MADPAAAPPMTAEALIAAFEKMSERRERRQAPVTVADFLKKKDSFHQYAWSIIVDMLNGYDNVQREDRTRLLDSAIEFATQMAAMRNVREAPPVLTAKIRSLTNVPGREADSGGQ